MGRRSRKEEAGERQGKPAGRGKPRMGGATEDAKGGERGRHLLASRRSTLGLRPCARPTQSGRKRAACSGSSAKQHGPTEGPKTTRMSAGAQPSSVVMADTVAAATPSSVPLQPKEDAQLSLVAVLGLTR